MEHGRGTINNCLTRTYNIDRMDSERAFVTNALQGMGIAVLFAFLILVFSTMNIFIALFATLSIAGIISCVLGLMKFNGWEFGVTESISCVILIGFSVDYVVHLGNHYTEACFEKRFDKIRESLREIGISILGGAITTLGAGIPLFFCIIIFFNKFAVLIVSSILYSLMFSLVFFTCLCHMFGPQHGYGDLKPHFKRLKEKIKRCCCKKSSQTK
jgi:protein dispatched 1